MLSIGYISPATAARGASSSVVAEAIAASKEDARKGELTQEELRIVEKLKARDREVRAHEQAHKTVGGRYAGQFSYTYEGGPDGNRYAVGGEVPIDVSPVSGNPKATVAKMETVIAAALAPAEPSSQDRAVAQQAKSIKTDAQAEIRREKAEESQARSSETDGAPLARADLASGGSYDVIQRSERLSSPFSATLKVDFFA